MDKKRYQKALSYEYSPASFIIYLGLEGVNLEKHGFGRHNTWHMEQWDMNKLWETTLSGNFEKPWFFLSTPTTHSKNPGIAPPGGEILEIETFVDYALFEQEKKKGYAAYAKLKMKLANQLLKIVEEKYLPGLQKHIAVKVVGTPTTNEDFVLAPRGNAYGSMLNPKNMGFGRLKAQSPWKNLFWCNASSGYGGIYGTTRTGMALYMNLTKDWFYDFSKEPIADLPK